jgi:hypothetical protein
MAHPHTKLKMHNGHHRGSLFPFTILGTPTIATCALCSEYKAEALQRLFD